MILAFLSVLGDYSGTSIIRAVITLAVFTGLCARSIIAWQWARWTNALGAIILFIVCILTFESLSRQPGIAIQILSLLILSIICFVLLGTKKSKRYFIRSIKNKIS